MERHSYEEIAKIEYVNWWYAARRELIDGILTRLGRRFQNALDMGCGTGANFSALRAHAERVTGLDLSNEALRYCQSLGYAQVIQASAEAVTIPSSSYDLVLCADLLEHGNDERMMSEISRVLRPGGFAIITVPAHRILWNWNDLYGHHKRRYSRKQLERLFSAYPMKISWIRHWNAVFFFPVLFVALFQRILSPPDRLANNLSMVPSFFNARALSFLRIENALIHKISLPFGVSYVSILQKT